MKKKPSSHQRSNLRQPNAFTSAERGFLAQACEELDEDHCVENLIDSIRDCECMFAFKVPLKTDFDDARDAALNCLEIKNPTIPPRKITPWLKGCIGCYDQILLVYLRDVLEIQPKTSKYRGQTSVPERDVYNAYKALENKKLKAVGEWHNYLYGLRNELEHRHKVVDGKLKKLKIRAKDAKRIYEAAIEMLSKSGETMVKEYRSSFPEHCTD